MIELRRHASNAAWWHFGSNFVPTQNLTGKEIRLLAEREAMIDRLANLKSESIWLKINAGIYKGCIFPAVVDSPRSSWEVVDAQVSVGIESNNDVRCSKGSMGIYHFTKDLDQSKGWTWSKRMAYLHILTGNLPITFKEAAIYPEFFGGDVDKSVSVLLDYEGDRVFQINEKKRPLTFKDRLDQDVTIGDLVVVALNYGGGLDVCMVKGFDDERRMVIESVDSGNRDRIALVKNATVKVMKMPNSLRDTAMMMKLGRNT